MLFERKANQILIFALGKKKHFLKLFLSGVNITMNKNIPRAYDSSFTL